MAGRVVIRCGGARGAAAGRDRAGPRRARGPQGPGVTLIKLRYADSAPIRLRGPITGRAYDFSGAEPVQEVDVRDAAIFVRSTRLRLSAQ